MQITSIKTVKNCKAMEKDCSYKFIDNTEKERNLINIYPNIEYQEIKGFGGAFTEAAAVTLNKLSKENREKLAAARQMMSETRNIHIIKGERKTEHV